MDEDDDKKAKSGRLRRWFGGGGVPVNDDPALETEADLLGADAEAAAPIVSAPKQSWLQRLRLGLSRSSTTIARGVADIFTKRKLDAASLDDLEDVLIQADLGLAAASRIREAVAHGRYERGISPDEVKRILADEVERALDPVARPLMIDPLKRPFVILVVGVNGSGKTTTIGKLAAKFRAEGKAVLLAAGDTFRAAAIEQLRIWARRTFSALVERDQGADAAGLAFDALTRARELNVDVVLMDTAGRLQNRAELMSELEKIIRVMRKVDSDAPHAVLLVLDATVGQNALSQVEIFGRIAGVTGLVMTKLDGTARGGILVAIADKFALPVHFIGVGEGVDDLEPFTARDFADAIAGNSRARRHDGASRTRPPLTETAAPPQRKALNPIVKFILELGPLALFFAVYSRLGIFAATGVLMAGVLVTLIVSYAMLKRIPIMPLVTAVIVLIFGSLTLIFHDETLIKIKPTALYVLFGAALFVGLWLKKPLLKILFDGALHVTEEGWRKLTWRWAFFFLGLAVLNEIIWRTQTTDLWVKFKTFGFLPLTLLFAVSQAPLIMKYEAKDEGPGDDL